MSTATRTSRSPDSPRALRLLGAFLRRDFAVAGSYRFPFVLDMFFGVLQLSVYYFLGRTFVDIGPAELDGAPSYFAFAAVGVVVALVIEAAVQGIAERVREGQLSGSLEALLAQPVTPSQLCLGFTGFPFAFAIVRASIYLLVAGLLLDLELGSADWLGLGVVFAGAGAAIASLGILGGAALVVFKRGDAITGLLVFGMTLVSGAVFPVSVLPGLLETLGSVLPLRFAFDGARAALFEGAGWGDDAIALFAFAVVAIPLSLWLFTRAIVVAQRAGSLGEY